MCKPFKEYLAVVREYTREIVTFAGFAIATFVYTDFKEFVAVQQSTAMKTAEVLQSIDLRLQEIKDEHRRTMQP